MRAEDIVARALSKTRSAADARAMNSAGGDRKLANRILKREATRKERSVLLKEAFNFFDDDHSGTLCGDQLVRAFEAVDVSFDECTTSREIHARLDSLLPIVDGNRDDAVNFHDFQRMVEGHLLSHSIKGVYFVSITLAEAEAIRALMHAEKSIGGLTKDFSTKESRPDFQGSGANASEREEQDYDNSAVAISIGHTIIDASQNWSKVFGKAEADEDPHDAQDEDEELERRHAFHSRKAADHRGAYMIDAAVQMFRFVDSDVQFSTRARSMVLRAVESNTCDARRAWFEAVRSCRRRMHVKDLGETPVHSILKYRTAIDS